jgi:hypothetical protein
MAYTRTAGLEDDVSALMGAADEALWKRADLFASTDTLGAGTTSLTTSSFDLTSQPVSPRRGIEGVSPIDIGYLPGLSGSHLFAEKSLPVSGQEEGGRVYGFPRSQGKVRKALGTPGGRRRQWKENKVIKRMVLGSDIGLEETCRLALCGLVGRLSYCNLCKVSLPVWVEQTWFPLLGYAPEVLFLTKGWFGFIFKSSDDLTQLLGKRWVIGGNNLMLKRWRVTFDPTTEYFQFLHLWVLLPGLPLQLWNEGG